MENRTHRRPGTENTLCRFTYSEVARLSNRSIHTVKRYAWTKKYDPHDLDSVLSFIAEHRKRQGMEPLGL